MKTLPLTYDQLKELCSDWMKKQSPLELYRDYNDYADGNQVREFLDYVEKNKDQNQDPEDYLYDYFTSIDNYNWFNDYEYEQFREYFREPFLEEHPELDDQEEEIDEILRDLMYDLDMYDANLKHFNKGYHFYLLTDPEKTIEIGEYPNQSEYKYKYWKSLIHSQGRTANSTSVRHLHETYNANGICIMLNIDLFDMVNIILSKKITVKKGSEIYLFNPYVGTGSDTVELTSDWTFKINTDELGFGCDGARKGPRGYTPEQVYDWYHPYFNKNKIYFNSFNLKK